MTEEKTLGRIAFGGAVRNWLSRNTGGILSEIPWVNDEIRGVVSQEDWEAAASAVREKVIEECAQDLESANIEAYQGEPAWKLQDYFAERIRSLKASASGDRTAPASDQRELETNLIHPHPRQDGQQCDHPISEVAK